MTGLEVGCFGGEDDRVVPHVARVRDLRETDHRAGVGAEVLAGRDPLVTGRLDEAGRLRERAARIQTRAGDEA